MVISERWWSRELFHLYEMFEFDITNMYYFWNKKKMREILKKIKVIAGEKVFLVHSLDFTL